YVAGGKVAGAKGQQEQELHRGLQVRFRSISHHGDWGGGEAVYKVFSFDIFAPTVDLYTSLCPERTKYRSLSLLPKCSVVDCLAGLIDPLGRGFY
ncbi:MAG: hypothetical protein ACPGTU_12380, partial [Myxococcota bacterium]